MCHHLLLIEIWKLLIQFSDTLHAKIFLFMYLVCMLSYLMQNPKHYRLAKLKRTKMKLEMSCASKLMKVMLNCFSNNGF